MPNEHSRNDSNDNMPRDKNESSKPSKREGGKGQSQTDKKSSPAMGFLGDTATGNVPKDAQPK
jgi:hypothetical protein